VCSSAAVSYTRVINDGRGIGIGSGIGIGIGIPDAANPKWNARKIMANVAPSNVLAIPGKL